MKKSPEKLEAESCIGWESVYVKYLRKCKCYIPPLLTICHGIYTYIFIYIYLSEYIYRNTPVSCSHFSIDERISSTL